MYMSSPSPPQSLLLSNNPGEAHSHAAKSKNFLKKSAKHVSNNKANGYSADTATSQMPWSSNHHQHVTIPVSALEIGNSPMASQLMTQKSQHFPSNVQLQSINHTNNSSLLKSMAYYNPVMMMNLLAAASSSSTSSSSVSSSTYSSSSSSSSSSCSNLDTTPNSTLFHPKQVQKSTDSKKSGRYSDEDENDAFLSHQNQNLLAHNKNCSNLIMLMMMSKYSKEMSRQQMNSSLSSPLMLSSTSTSTMDTTYSPNQITCQRKFQQNKSNFAIVSTLID